MSRALRRPGLRLAPIALALVACGGTKDGSRPSLTRDLGSTAFDECAASAGLEFLSILSYEPGQRSTDVCDNSTSCVNLNYDQGSATRCDVDWTVHSANPDQDSCDSTPNPDDPLHPLLHLVNDSPRDCKNISYVRCLAPDGNQYPDDPTQQQPSASNYCVTHSPSVPSAAAVERCGQTSQAAHVVGRNLAICYSPRSHKAGWGGNYRLSFATPVDASAWDGVSFWAKTGDGATGTGLLPHVLDRYTNGTAGTPPCSTSAKETTPDQSKCDPFGLSVVLSSEWRFFQMPFDEVRQKGFGMASPLGQIDRSAISNVEFTFTAGDWDFWVDDVAFYRAQR